jgi:hypothetical protein
MFNLLAALLCRHPRPDTAQLSRRPFRPNPASHRLAQFEVAQMYGPPRECKGKVLDEGKSA